MPHAPTRRHAHEAAHSSIVLERSKNETGNIFHLLANRGAFAHGKRPAQREVSATEGVCAMMRGIHTVGYDK